MKPLFWLIHVQAFSLCSMSSAFSGRGEKTSGELKPIHRYQQGAPGDKRLPLVWQVLPAALMLASCQPPEPASAAPFGEYPLLTIPSSSKVAPNQSYNLPDTDAFKMLRREPRLSGAVKELKELQELQDNRLEACEDKGIFWEQCFMYGQRDGISVAEETTGRMDNQLVSPVGSLEVPAETRKIPTW